MPKPTESQLRGAISRHLETDLLLGIRAVPLTVPRPGPTGPSAASWRSAPARAGQRTASGRGGVPAVQNVSDDELARRRTELEQLDAEQVTVCTKCLLHESRTKTVFGQGHPAARLVFVGEAPGRDEDLQGLAFVGRAGQLLTKMIQAMGLSREEVFICNILKCRPPGNRDPAPDEIAQCWPYLDRQLQIIQPEVIVTLGRPASQTLLRTTVAIGKLRGNWHEYSITGEPGAGQPTPLMPTYHPAYLLRSQNEKGKAWSDLKQVMAKLGFPVPQ